MPRLASLSRKALMAMACSAVMAMGYDS